MGKFAQKLLFLGREWQYCMLPKSRQKANGCIFTIGTHSIETAAYKISLGGLWLQYFRMSKATFEHPGGLVPVYLFS